MPYANPKFPVVNPKPSVDDCIKSMRIRDVAVGAGITSAAWSYGYIFGKPARMPTASTAAAIGMTFAGMVVLQDTRGRLMGYCENSREVRLYGAVQQPDVVENDRRFPRHVGLRSEAMMARPKVDNYN